MKCIIGIFLGIVFAFPVACSACPLCTPIGTGGDTPDCFYRHLNRQCGYDFSGVGTAFKDRMNNAIAEWETYASITMYEDGSEWCIMWEYDNTPADLVAHTVVTVNTTTSDICGANTTFMDTILNRPWE